MQDYLDQKECRVNLVNEAKKETVESEGNLVHPDRAVYLVILVQRENEERED